MQENGKLWLLFIVDLAVMYLLYYWFYRFDSGAVRVVMTAKALGLMGAIFLAWLMITLNSHLCSLNASTTLFDLLLTTVKAYSFLSAMVIALVVVFDDFKPNANHVLYPLLISFFVSIGLRCIVFAVRKHFTAHGYMQKNLLVVGGDRIAERVVKRVMDQPELGYRVHGIVADYYHETMPKGLYLGGIDRINELLSSNVVDEVLIAMPLRREKEILAVVDRCEFEGVRFRIVPDFFRVIENRAVLDYLSEIPMISIRTEPLQSLKNRAMKRAFDLVFSFCVLMALLPFMIVLKFVIESSSPGPLFFKQKRVGANNKEFEMFKFRTMKVQEKKDSDTIWTTENDDRVTKVGAFLRRHNLDELPQFWNVFVGNMSVVGPRPERKFFVEQFKEEVPRYKVRHQVKSGITGWAQVNGLRGDTSIKKRIEHDLYYIENWSFWWDMVIIWKTLFGSKTNENAY